MFRNLRKQKRILEESFAINARMYLTRGKNKVRPVVSNVSRYVKHGDMKVKFIYLQKKLPSSLVLGKLIFLFTINEL